MSIASDRATVSEIALPDLDFDKLVGAVLNSRYQWVSLDDAVDMAIATARYLVDGNAARITAGAAPLDVHRSVSAMRRVVEARGLLEDEAEHDPDRPLVRRPPASTSAGVRAVVDALELIDRHGRCTNFTSRRCWDYGRRRGAKHGADMWCDACVARDALNRLAEDASS